MRCLLPVALALLLLPALALELPSPCLLEAVQGREPFATCLEAGVPVPPTREEIRQKSGLRMGHERLAIKRAMVYRTSMAKSARNRITPENNRCTAALARRTGAPDVFSRYLELLADNTLSRRQVYAVNQALRYLLYEVYHIDELQIRLVSESLNLPAAEHVLFMQQMPVAYLYDCVSAQPTEKEKLLADIQTITGVLRQCNDILTKVHDRTSADAAAVKMLALLPEWSTTLQTRLNEKAVVQQFTAVERLAVQLLNDTAAKLTQTRRLIHSKDWFDSTRLQTVDEIFR